MKSPTAGFTATALNDTWLRTSHRQTLLTSRDRDCAQDLVSRVFRPHRLEPKGGRADLIASMETLRAAGCGICLLRYHAAVDILPGPLDDFYLIQMPLRGSAVIEAGGEAFLSDTGCASLLSPEPDLSMHWGAGNEQLIVRIEAQAVQRFVDSWCGRRLGPPPTFDPRLHLDQHPALREVLHSMIEVADWMHAAPDEAGPAAEAAPAGLSAAQLQHRLLAILLSSQPHSASDCLAASSPPVAPRCVRLVEDYLVAHCHEPLTPEGLAQLAGVSVRSLFLGFQRYRGVSPMRMLRELRLQRVRDELLRAPPGRRIGDIAMRWGFYHLGRFGQEYRQAYGELPRQTLAAGRYT